MSLLDKQFKIKKTGDSYILYDASLIAEPTLQLFDRDYHTNQSAQQNNSSLNAESGIGRAKVVYFQNDGRTLVLKHYYRGGFVARLIKDRYFGCDIENTRAFREWRLLKKMHSLGLPVPDAIAAHVNKGLLSFRANLITEKIENSKTLADVLSDQVLDAGLWRKIGACIKLFHQQNIYHADLNARNILLTHSEVEPTEIYLIDFDNSNFRADSKSWKTANLARLKRSLMKFKNNIDGFNFSEENWSDLIESYKL